MATLFPMPQVAKPLPSEIVRDAHLSENQQYRWTLARTWRAGPHVCWIGFNPSTADHRKDDPTVLRWIHFAHAWGYGGFVAVNLYPFRSPNPDACRKWADWTNNGPDWHARDCIHQNIDWVAREAQRAAIIVACWGNDGHYDDIAEHTIEEIQARAEPKPIMCLGKTNCGAPKHPMARGHHRIPDDQQPIVWRAA